MRTEWAFVLLDGFVYEHVSFELILAVKGGFTLLTPERFLTAMDQRVHLEVMLCLESLLTDLTNMLTLITKRQEKRVVYSFFILQAAIFPLSKHVIRFHELPAETLQRIIQ